MSSSRANHLKSCMYITFLQAGFQFKSSLAELMTILMSKDPSYIRCIKPNDHKQPGETRGRAQISSV